MTPPTVTDARRNLRGAGSSVTDRADSPWALAALTCTLCVITTVSMFASGNAAILLLLLGLAAVVLGIPAYLVVGQLRSNRTEMFTPRAANRMPSVQNAIVSHRATR